MARRISKKNRTDGNTALSLVTGKQYRDGGAGFCKWVEDHVKIPIYPEGDDVAMWTYMRDLPTDINPETKRAYNYIWEMQKEVCMDALEMIDGRFRYRLIVLCWPRGEGKSLLVVLIQLWKFFNWPRQQIVLGANSKDQTKFVHYDMMRDIILNSPNLLQTVGRANVQDKEIRLKDADGTIRSVLKPISTASGIVSNITGYTFSEMFDMRNPKFFTQLDGSTRNIPNALGLIDSTVSEKSHVLYHLYQNFVKKKTKTLFFSYRCSELGVQEDYWNPFMSQMQLEDYRAKFLEAEFARYFLNVWSAGASKVFTKSMIDEISQLGMNGQLLNHHELVLVNEKIENYENQVRVVTEKGFTDAVDEVLGYIDVEKSKVTPVSQFYTLEDNYQNVQLVSPDVLTHLGDQLSTDWAILVGVDLADPLAIRKKANSIMTVIAKGLPRSKTDPQLAILDEKEMLQAKFVYFVVGFFLLESKTPIVDIKKRLDEIMLMYDGVDCICGERYGLWDLATWAEERDVPFVPIYPNYERQRAAFNHLYSTMHMGLLKAPTIPVRGVKGEEDIFREELGVFDHNTNRRWFGSPEKDEKYGIQDDSIYAIGWGMYGGREIGPDQFRSLEYEHGDLFGSLFTNKEVAGNY
jgi:hypothetical protein